MDTKKLKQKVLDLAIRGKLVPQDPNDEPASKLLERIYAEKQKLISEGKIKKEKRTSFIFKGEDNSYYEKVEENGKETIRDITAEIPFDIPETWAWTRGFMCFAEMGTCAPSEDYFYYIDIDSIDNKVQAVKSPKKVFTKDAPSRAKRKIHLGDTLFSLVRPYLRNIAYIDTSLKDCIASTGFFVFTPLEFILPEYSYLMILSEYVTMGLNSYMKGDNSPSIRKENIENYLFPIPPQKEQRRIVELQKKFKQSLSLIGEDSFVLKHKIKQTKSKLLDLAIRGKLLPQNPNDEPASALLERIREEQASTKTKRKSIGSYIFKGEDNLYYEQIGSETKCIQDEIPFNIPNSWAWARLGSISEVISKGTTPRGGKLVYLTKGIGFLRVENIGENFCLDMRALRYIDKDINDSVLRRSKLNHKDILISIAGTLGKIAYIPNGNQQFNANQAIAFVRLINKDITIVKYIANYLSSKIIQSIYKNMSKTTAIPNLTLEIISKTLIPFPPISEQKRIVEYISKANYQLDSMLRE